jgi:hypothetical protein
MPVLIKAVENGKARVIVEALKELLEERLLVKAVRVIKLIIEVVRMLVEVSKRSKKNAG